jgi:hypothetical protein
MLFNALCGTKHLMSLGAQVCLCALVSAHILRPLRWERHVVLEAQPPQDLNLIAAGQSFPNSGAIAPLFEGLVRQAFRQTGYCRPQSMHRIAQPLSSPRGQTLFSQG